MQAADQEAGKTGVDSLDIRVLKGLKVSEVNSWQAAEDMRKRLHSPGSKGGRFSRAKLCQRAVLSESTFTKGLKAGTPPSPRKLKQLRLVLEGRRHELMAKIEGRNGA